MQLNGWDRALKVTAGGTGLVGHAGAVLLRNLGSAANRLAGPHSGAAAQVKGVRGALNRENA